MHRFQRVFQAGTQRRSVPHFQFAVQLAQSGKLGKLKSLHAHPGGMGTGMPMWGSIFTDEQIWTLVGYLYTFQFNYTLEVK